jgi:HlyD family secretion protein
VTNRVPDKEPPEIDGSATVVESALEERESAPLSAPHNERTPRTWLSSGRGVLIGIGIGVALAVGGTQLLSSRSTKAPAPAKTPTPTTSVASTSGQSVTVAKVETSSVNRTLEATGSVAAGEMVPVSSQATGLQIKDILVDEGDIVKAGQVMARLDDSVLQAQLAQAKASVAQAEARLTELRAGSRKEEIAQAQARLDQAKARLSQAQASIPRQIEQAQAQVESARARLTLADNRYKSYQSLVDQGAVTRDRYNESLSDYRSAQANLSEAQQRLEQARNTNNPEIDS